MQILRPDPFRSFRGSHDFDANNLMQPSDHDGDRIDDPKRLTDAQHRAITASPLLDAP
jgi:hypothetical protein